MIKIEILDAIYCKVKGREAIQKLKPCLAYPVARWRQGQYGAQKRASKEASFIDGRNGNFLTGFLPRIEEYLKERKLKYKITGQENLEKLKTKKKAKLKDIIFWEDQEKAINAAIEKQRGIILFPTGTGKTLIAGGIFSRLQKNHKGLFLAHTTDLVTQALNDFKEYGLSAYLYKSDTGFDNSKQITVATIQTFSKVLLEEFYDYYDAIIIDEVHHLSEPKVRYAELMESNIAPIRIGLTATVPDNLQKGCLLIEDDRLKSFTMEGYTGGIIAELSLREAQKKGIIAKIEVDLRIVPYVQSIAEKYEELRYIPRGYKDLYYFGIVSNRYRNKDMIMEAKRMEAEKRSTLILVEDIEHGFKLLRLGKALGVEMHFAAGSLGTNIQEKTSLLNSQIIGIKKKFKLAEENWTGKELEEVENAYINQAKVLQQRIKSITTNIPDNVEIKKVGREKVKERLKAKEIYSVVASRVWFEGMNIPSLDKVINAGGYKAKAKTLQIPGRALRMVKGKDTVGLIDYLDPYRYLAEHTVFRIQHYVNQGYEFKRAA